MPASDHQVFKQPNDLNAKIWRYMDLAKFISLLVSEGLYFTPAAKLGDPFEGSYPTAQSSGAIEPKFQDESGEPFIPDQRMLEFISNFQKNNLPIHRQNFVEQTYVNCWHLSEYESAAMWNLYSKSNESICLQTTYATLSDILPKDIHIGCVRYIDYEKDVFPSTDPLEPFIHKRKSYEHEREIRAVLPCFKGTRCSQWRSGDGCIIPIKPSELIHTVYVHPESPAWFGKVVQGIIEKFGLQVPVNKSEISKDPIY